MIPRFLVVLQIVTMLVGLRTMPTSAADLCRLPDVVFLGEGAGTYTLPNGYDTLIVKQFNPFRFGAVSANSVTFTEANNGGYVARAWASTGTSVPSAHFGEKVSLGTIDAGMLVRTMMIDDDNDNRLTTIVNESESVYTVLQPAMVQLIEFTTTHKGEYFIDSADSITFWPVCALPFVPDDPTVFPTHTATATPLPTGTPTPPSTVTPSATPTVTLTPTPTFTPSATATQTAMNTPTVTTTATATPSPTSTPTLGVPTGLTPFPQVTLRPEWQMYIWLPDVRR